MHASSSWWIGFPIPIQQQLMVDWFPNTDPTATHGGLVSQYRSNSNSWWIGFPIPIQQQLMVDWFPNTDPTATHGGLVSQYRSNSNSWWIGFQIPIQSCLECINRGGANNMSRKSHVPTIHVPTIRFRNCCATVARLAKPSSLRPLWRTRGGDHWKKYWRFNTVDTLYVLVRLNYSC